MGGTNESTINGLRMHVKDGNVHVHDDKASLKWSYDAAEFKKVATKALKGLSGADGVATFCDRAGTSLCVGNDPEGNMFISLFKSGDKLDGFKSFIKGI